MDGLAAMWQKCRSIYAQILVPRLVPFCYHLRVSPTRKSRQLHPKNRLDEILILSHSCQIPYRYLFLKVRTARTCRPSLFCTRVQIVLSFLARSNSCISASHTSGSHVWRDCQVNASLARIKQDEQGRFPSVEAFCNSCDIELRCSAFIFWHNICNKY